MIKLILKNTMLRKKSNRLLARIDTWNSWLSCLKKNRIKDYQTQTHNEFLTKIVKILPFITLIDHTKIRKHVFSVELSFCIRICIEFCYISSSEWCEYSIPEMFHGWYIQRSNAWISLLDLLVELPISESELIHSLIIQKKRSNFVLSVCLWMFLNLFMFLNEITDYLIF